MKFSWNSANMAFPKLVLTAEDSDFDPNIVENWKAEGFDVSYVPFGDSRNDYVGALQRLADPLGLGEYYAIVGVLVPRFYLGNTLPWRWG